MSDQATAHDRASSDYDENVSDNASPQWRAGSKNIDPGQNPDGSEKAAIEHSESVGGEDEGSTEGEGGDDSHLHDDQKSPTFPNATPDENDEGADKVPSDSPTKTQDLAKAGRADFDPNLGQE